MAGNLNVVYSLTLLLAYIVKEKYNVNENIVSSKKWREAEDTEFILNGSILSTMAFVILCSVARLCSFCCVMLGGDASSMAVDSPQLAKP